MRDNPDEFRYEIPREGEPSASCSTGDRIGLVRTEVLPSVKGQWAGSRPIAGALDHIRARGPRVIRLCPFVVAHLRRQPEQRDLIDRDRTAL